MKTLNRLTEKQARALEYDWRFWARPKQLPPEGDWRVWLILAGRGFGKTRAITEWAREQAEQMPGSRGAIVSSTAADTRDIVVEGESGVLSVCPPWNKPTYQPTKRRLTWPNGTVATLFSADQPDRLRGPQHHWVVADELCLVAGTQIATANGPLAIEQVLAGDYVWTRKGLRRVRHAWCSNPSATVYRMTTSDGRQLTGTENHPIWVKGKGFTPLSLLQYGDIIEGWDITDPSQANPASTPVSNGGGEDGGLSTVTIRTGEDGYCIGPFTKNTTATYRKIWTSIISTAIERTTIYPTWKHCLGQSISSATALKDGDRILTSRGAKTALLCGRNGLRMWRNAPIVALNLSLLEPGLSIAPITASRRTDAKLSARKIIEGSKNSHAPIAVRHSTTNIQRQNTAPKNAIAAHVEDRNVNASSVRRLSEQKIRAPNAAQENADTSTAPIFVKVEQLATSQPVYNLEVEGCHEYFANGILTHNCAWRYAQHAWDMMMFGLRLGRNPRCAVATTPRPIPVIKGLVEDPFVKVQRGTTYENRSNLAPAFYSQIIKKYEGSRLGRQELFAQLLDDVPGALWTHSMLEENRVRDAPALVRIVIAIDPAVTANEETSNETGIIVAGIDKRGHGYVLDDLSGIYTPYEWAKRAIDAYDLWQADTIIGEVNNGGDLVKSNITSTAEIMSFNGERAAPRGSASVPFRTVRATRGKYTRAEPVSTLDEQHRIHHVGLFGPLEDQLCLVAGTQIATPYGDKNIEDISPGDYVLTRNGARRVLWSGCTGKAQKIVGIQADNGCSLLGTMGHPVYTVSSGFIAMNTLDTGDELICLNRQNAKENIWPNLDDMVPKSFIRAGSTHWRKGHPEGFITAMPPQGSCSTESFGRMSEARYRTGITSTILMGTRPITIYPISNVCPLQNITKNTTAGASQFGVKKSEVRTESSLGKAGSLQNIYATGVALNLKVPARGHDGAAPPVVASTITQKSVQRREQPVYNLQVEGEAEYFANGILVHNCTWIPGEESPDRLDARVWAFTALMIHNAPDNEIPASSGRRSTR